MSYILSNNISIKREIRTSDGKGSWETSFNNVATIKGRIDPARSVKTVEYQKKSYNVAAILFCYIGSNIQQGDKVIFGSDEYIAMVPLNPFSLNHHLEIELIRTI